MTDAEPANPSDQPNLWDRVSATYHAAVALPPAERSAFLHLVTATDPVLRGEVEAMLAATDAESGLELERRLLLDAPAERLAAGTRIGPYCIESLIGEGGMSEVYRAERVDGEFRQTVALKILHAELRTRDLIRRFQLERQILVRLVHPSIVAILDGGATDDGRPYLIMPYVDGLPVTDHCERNGVDLSGRLRLFRQVAEAVQFAHGHLVVHRDLKPSNILVTPAGEVRLLDFGIAKLLGSEGEPAAPQTQSMVRLLTPEHAAPEQVRGEPVTTATDVYALGVLLFQLVTGEKPHHAAGRTVAELEHDILHVPASLPSTVARRPWRRRLRGDLDRIVLMALRKEASRRYTTAGQLAEDVERYLTGLPVRAEPDTAGYRLRKFIGRHRVGVSAGAAIALILAGAAGWSAMQARRVAAERDRAQQEQAAAESVVGILTALFQRANPRLVPGGDTMRVRDLLADAERQVDSLETQPALQARMWHVLGAMHEARGQYAHARELLERSYARQLALPDSDSAELARTYHDLARVVQRYEGPDASVEMLRRSVDRLRRALGRDHPAVRDALLDLAGVTNDLDESRRIVDSIRTLGSAVGREDSLGVAMTLTTQAAERNGRGRFVEAVSLYETALRMQSAHLPRDHPTRLGTLESLVLALSSLGDFDRAEPLARELLELRRRIVPPDSGGIALALQRLGLIRAQQGAVDEAERLFRETLAIERRVFAPDHWFIENDLRNLGQVLAAQGRLPEGIAAMDTAIRHARERSDGGPMVAFVSGQRAVHLITLGRLAEARSALQAVERAFQRIEPGRYEAQSNSNAYLQSWLGILSLAEGEPDSALHRFRAVYEALLDLGSAATPRAAQAACGIGISLTRLGRAAEAARWLRPGCQIHERWGIRNPLMVRWGREAMESAQATAPVR